MRAPEQKIVSRNDLVKLFNGGLEPLAFLTSDSDMEAKPECDELKQKLRQALDENVKLQAIISDITQVNKRWQRYNSDRQMYVQKLLNTIQDQQVQINNMGEEKAFPSKQTEEPSDVCTRKDCLAARDEVKRLTENVQLLEFQVKAHKDDWEAERNEKREVIKHRDDTKAQLVETVRELHALRKLLSQCSCFSKTYNIGCEQEESNRAGYKSRRPSESTSAGYNRLGHSGRGPCDLFNDGDLTCDGGAEDTACGGLQLDDLLADGEDAACALTDPAPQTSYSRSSTLPDSAWTEEERLPVVSVCSAASVRLPVVKSSSAPERRPPGRPPKCAASISLTLLPSPSDTLTRHHIDCPGCGLRFAPDSHLEFLDHFEGCQKA